MSQLPKHIISELSNGLRFVFVPAPDKDSVSVTLQGKVGRRAELDEELGAAHFLEHLFFDGTKRRPGALEINRLIDETGARRGGSTSTEYVKYFAKVIGDKAEVAFDFISDIFLNSLLKNIDIDKERKVIAQEAATSQDDPYKSLFWQERPTIYPNQRLGRTFLDEVNNLPNMTREIVLRYYRRSYVAQNFVLCVVGDLDYDTAKKLAEEYLSRIPKGKEVIFEKPRFCEEKIVNIQNRDVQQSKMAMTFKGFDLNNKMTVPANMLANILGSGLSSRLSDRLRNKLHLVYSVFAVNSKFSDIGDFSLITFVDESKLQQALDEIIKEVQILLSDGITNDELEKAKNMSLSGLLFSIEDPANLGDAYAYRYMLTGKVKEIEQTIEEIKAATKEQVLEAAKIIFSDKPKVNVITRTIKALRLDPVAQMG